MKINDLIKNTPDSACLYNLNLSLNETTLKKFYGIKYVIMQGSPLRTHTLAEKIAGLFLNIDSNFFTPVTLFKTQTFVAYRIDDILCVSHGMGNSSITTLLHNLTKVLYLAGNTELEYIRVGTSGGIDIEPGNVVLTKTAYMPNLIAGYKVSAIGKDIISNTYEPWLKKRILAAQPPGLGFNVLEGNTITADDFYLGQGRFDGAIKPKYDLNTRNAYFLKVKGLGILNFEMEATGLASFCNRADIPATMIAVTLLNRLLGDQVKESADKLAQYSENSFVVVLNYLNSIKNNSSFLSSPP